MTVPLPILILGGVLAVAAAVLLLWAIAAVVSRFLHSRQTGYPIFPWQYTNVVPYTRFDEAIRVAEDRRTRLTAFLREFRGQSVAQEFIEVPPGVPDSAGRAGQE